jgi:hypothetical protein
VRIAAVQRFISGRWGDGGRFQAPTLRQSGGTGSTGATRRPDAVTSAAAHRSQACAQRCAASRFASAAALGAAPS